MGQRLNDATVTDALITLSMESVQEARYTTQIMQQRRMHESSHQRRSAFRYGAKRKRVLSFSGVENRSAVQGSHSFWLMVAAHAPGAR